MKVSFYGKDNAYKSLGTNRKRQNEVYELFAVQNGPRNKKIATAMEILKQQLQKHLLHKWLKKQPKLLNPMTKIVDK